MCERPRLIAFTDLSRGSWDTALQRYTSLAAHARPKSVLFVVRDYASSARERLRLAQDLAAVSRQTEQLLGVAERADIARAVGAQALHLPELGLAEAQARAFAPGTFVSRACHEPGLALASAADGVLLSPIFEARKGRVALGLALLAQVCAARDTASPLVYALGGVNAEHARACLAAGAAGVAVIGAALEPDPLALLEALEINR